MGFVYWSLNADGDWSVAADWGGGGLPTSADSVTISSGSLHTVTHSVGDDFIVSLLVGNDIFEMTAGGALTIASSLTTVNGLGVSGGVLTIGTTASIAGGYTQTGGSVLATGPITITGTAGLLGGALGGGATVKVSGTTVLANYTIGGSVQLLNAHTLDQTGNLTLGDATGINALIANQTGATYNIANAVTITSGAATARLTNAGTLADLTGTGTSVIGVSASNTGTVSIGQGSTLVFAGAQTSLAGDIVGTGTLGFGGGTTTVASTVTLAVPSISVSGNGTDVVFGASTTLSSGYSQSGGSTLDIGGKTLTITGATQFAQTSQSPVITGSGALITDGATEVLGSVAPAMIIGGSLAWDNAGTVTAGAGLEIGNSNTAAASLTNEAAGVFDLTGDVAISSGSTPLSSLTNAGTLAMIANGGASTVTVDVADTGTVSVALDDTLEFDGASNSFAGTISGAGQFALGGGGGSTIASGTAINVATFAIYGTNTTATIGGNGTIAGGFNISNNGVSVTLAGSETVLGSYSQGWGNVVTLDDDTLTLKGAATFYQFNGAPTVAGAGTLVTDGATTLSAGASQLDLTIGGSVAWHNFGTVNAVATLTVGNSNATAASVTNEAAGVFDLAGDATILNGSGPLSGMTNAGTLEMTADGGTSDVDVGVVDTGTVSAALNDTLQFDGLSNSFAGKITGAGWFGIAGGTNTIAANTAISVANFSVYFNGTGLTFGGNETLSDDFFQGWGTSIALGGHTLTLKSAATFYQEFQTPTMGGTGALVTDGATTLTAGANQVSVVIGGSVAWENFGAVNASGTLTIGNSNATAASVTNESQGVFDLAGSNAITNGSGPLSSFTNAGTFAMTANGGTAPIFVGFSSTGTVSVAKGDVLEFDGPFDTFGGTIAGAGTVGFGAGSSTITAGTSISVNAVSLYNDGTGLTFAGNETLAGSFFQGYGTTTTLSGTTLTVHGAAEFYQQFLTPTVGGTGVLVTDGATTLLSGANIVALVIGGGVAWDNAGTVTETGTLTVGNAALAAASVTNEAGGVFNLVGGDAILNGSAALSSFTNVGTFQQTAGAGTSSIGTSFANSGTVNAAAGVLDFAASVANTGTVLAEGGGNVSFGGSLSGTGVVDIKTAGSASFAGPVAASQTLDFLDATGSATIALTSPTSFAATIAGFVKGDTIDLKGVSGATASFAGGVLTFKSGTTVVAKLTFSGSHAFSFTPDGTGGTLIGDPPINSATVGLRDTAYFTNVGSATETIALTRAGEQAIAGFSFAHADVLDLRALLAGTAAAHDASLLGDYLTAHDGGGNTTLLFDPTGHGGGSAVAVLDGVRTSVDQLVAHHALIV